MPSSVISGWDYHPEEQTLILRFVSGKRYRYLKVPPEIYAAFQSAFAKGVYYNQCIRDRFMFEAIGEA